MCAPFAAVDSLIIKEKRVDPQRRARGLRGYLSTGSHPLPSMMYEYLYVLTCSHTYTHTHTYYLLVEFTVNVRALSAVDKDVVIKQSAVHAALFLMTCIYQRVFPNTTLILTLTYILTSLLYILNKKNAIFGP